MKKDEKEMILIQKIVWLQLLEAYDKQTNKFISVFKTIIICITIMACVWFGLYYFCNRPYVNNGVMQNGNSNSIENATVNSGGDN